ncbi:hypothetical protein T03_6686 [Trichinella britovi]|uniref:Uncharacterized protein n=1 Tax=Trichinella britovi TaxID=45882 RepID=A0A0V0Z2I2_TRIBR|nr:hypothetical protein T03_6686 [Trichinella britovi]
MEDCGLLRKRVNRDAKKRQPDKNTQVAPTQLLNPCPRKIGERNIDNETCSDFI